MTLIASRPVPTQLVGQSGEEAERASNARAFFAGNRWWIARAAVLPVHVAVFTVISFFLVRLVPGDPVRAALQASSTEITPRSYSAMAVSLGLNGSIWTQFASFAVRIIHGDFGNSVASGRPVWGEIWSRLPSTLELVVMGLFLCVLLAYGLGWLTLVAKNRILRRMLQGYGNLAGAIPDFAVGILGIVVFYLVLNVLPAPIGRLDPGVNATVVTGFPVTDSILTGNWTAFGSEISHLILPLCVIVFVYTPGIWRQLSLGLSQALAAPPTLFKIASGATRRAVFGSIIRRGSVSAIVMVGTLFGGLVGGVVVLEQLFNLGGIGQYAAKSVNTNDFLALQGVLIATAAVCLVVFFLVDIVTMLVDPRRRPGASNDI